MKLFFKMAGFMLSAISGLFTGASFNFGGLSFLIWFSLVPALYLIRKISIKERIFYGMVFGLCYYGAAVFWITKVTVLGFVFLLFYLSFYYAFFFILGKYLLNWPLKIITLPCLWVFVEFLKESIWCGFGWANLGYCLYENILLIQAADLLGAKFISFLIVMVNVLILEVIIFLKQRGKNRQGIKILSYKIIFVFLVFSAVFVYSSRRLGGLKSSGSVEVSVAQPNIPQELKWTDDFEPLILHKLYMLGKAAGNDTLVIMPEAAWPFIVNESNMSNLKEFVRSIEKDVLIGAVTEEEGDFYNTALLFDKSSGLMNHYRKIKLVPFGEYIPLRELLSFISVINSIGDMSRGRDFTRFSYKGKTFSVLICFEDVFPLHVLRFSRGRDFLVNITNDSWFGGEPEASQHLAIMTFRSVENRIPIIRGSNTGISGWVSLKGEITKLARDGKSLFFHGVKAFSVPTDTGRSFYNRHGEVFSLFCGIFVLCVFLRQAFVKFWAKRIYN